MNPLMRRVEKLEREAHGLDFAGLSDEELAQLCVESARAVLDDLAMPAPDDPADAFRAAFRALCEEPRRRARHARGSPAETLFGGRGERALSLGESLEAGREPPSLPDYPTTPRPPRNTPERREGERWRGHA